MNSKSKLLTTTRMALMCALAVIIGLFKFPIIPAAPFLELDFADVPILMGTALFGTIPGLFMLMTVSLIQAFLLGGNGWVGLVMHFVASGAMVTLLGAVCAKKKTLPRIYISVGVGAIIMTAIMIPMNYLFIPILFGAPKEAIDALVFPAIIPFNFIKAGLNGLLAAILFSLLRPFFRRQEMI